MEQNQVVQLNLRWPADAGSNPDLVSQFVISTPPQEELVYLLAGHTSAPIVLNEEDLTRTFEELGGALPVHVRGSFVMTMGRAKELHALLGEHIAKHSEAAGGRGNDQE